MKTTPPPPSRGLSGARLCDCKAASPPLIPSPRRCPCSPPAMFYFWFFAMGGISFFFFCIFDGVLAGEEWGGQEKEPCVMSAARLQPCHLREPRQLGARAHTQGFWRGGWGRGAEGGLGQYFSSDFNSTHRTRSSLKCFIFYFTSLHCISSIPFHFTGKGPRSAGVFRPRAEPSRASDQQMESKASWPAI